MTPNIQNLIAVWNNRPKRVLEFGNDEDWTVLVEIVAAVKDAMPDIQSVAESNALPSSVDGYPISGVTVAENDSDASTRLLGANTPWNPRWMDEATSPIPAPANAAVATPSSAEPTSPAAERSSHSQSETPREGGNDAVTDQTPGTSDKPATVDARLAAARRVAATSKQPSSPKRPRKRATVKPSTLP